MLTLPNSGYKLAKQSLVQILTFRVKFEGVNPTTANKSKYRMILATFKGRTPIVKEEKRKEERKTIQQ